MIIKKLQNVINFTAYADFSENFHSRLENAKISKICYKHLPPPDFITQTQGNRERDRHFIVYNSGYFCFQSGGCLFNTSRGKQQQQQRE